MGKVIVRKRGSGYEYRFEIAPVNGVRKWVQKSGFKTKSEALDAGAEALTEYNTAGAPLKPCNMSYSDYLDYWFEDYCKNSLAYNTITTYETLIRLYIKPRIGKYRLADIQSVTICNFLKDLVNDYEFSQCYYRNILKVVKGSFTYAVNHGFLKYNPSMKIKLPKRKYKKSREKHIFSQRDIDTIVERFKNNREFIAAFLTACYTGMRTGELLALTWNDINFDEGVISIKRSIYDKPKDNLGRWYIGSTKTENGVRTIPLCETLKEILLNYKEYQDLTKHLYASDYKQYGLMDIENDNDIMYGRVVDSKYGEYNLDFVFTREDGTYSGTDILKDPIRIINKELNIHCRFYDLRGSFATHALYGGINLKDISTALGHGDITTTDKFYISNMKDVIFKTIDGIDDIISSDVIHEVAKFEMNSIQQV